MGKMKTQKIALVLISFLFPPLSLPLMLTVNPMPLQWNHCCSQGGVRSESKVKINMNYRRTVPQPVRFARQWLQQRSGKTDV